MKYLPKLARIAIASLMFFGIWNLIGMELRQAQLIMFQLGGMILLAFLLDNIWVSAFVVWSVFTFAYYKFQVGDIYISNILAGSVIYYVTKRYFNKEHIRFYLDMFLWFVFVNVVMMALQSTGLDFIFRGVVHTTGPAGTYYTQSSADVGGMMGFPACMGVVMALAIPVLASRESKWALAGSILLFWPLYVSKASSAMVAGLVGLMFALFFKVNRKVWISSVVVLLLLGVAYIGFVDAPMGTLKTRPQQWSESLRDAIVHPVIGWGPDSFRNITPWKNKVYTRDHQVLPDGRQSYAVWDNAHNIYVQTFYEFGVIGLVILIGYLRFCARRFSKSIKTPDVRALAGFILVLAIVSIGQFPMYLARTVCFIIPMVALYEKITE